jgi:hypothetical protein
VGLKANHCRNIVSKFKILRHGTKFVLLLYFIFKKSVHSPLVDLSFGWDRKDSLQVRKVVTNDQSLTVDKG